MRGIERRYMLVINIIFGQAFLVMLLYVHSYWKGRELFEQFPPTAMALTVLVAAGVMPIVSAIIVREFVSFIEKEAESRLLELRFAFVLESMPAGVIAADNDGVVTFCNNMMLSILERDRTEVIGKRLVEIHRRFESLLADHPDGVRDRELVVRRPMERRHLLVDIGRLSASGEEPVGHVVLVKDITEIRRLQEQVVRAERLSAFGELAAIAAHEIRNPLTAIRGFLQILRGRAQPEEVGYFDLLLNETDRMNGLVEQMVVFANPAREQKQDVDVNNLILDSLLVAVPPDGPWITELRGSGRDEVRLAGKPGELKQVFINLFRNAVQAMPDGGALSISTSVEGDWLTARVSDTGCGIPSHMSELVFHPFVTTRAQGMGLGLAICRRIIREHGGDIRLLAGDRPGSTFVIRLPIGEQQTGHSSD